MRGGETGRGLVCVWFGLWSYEGLVLPPRHASTPQQDEYVDETALLSTCENLEEHLEVKEHLEHLKER